MRKLFWIENAIKDLCESKYIKTFFDLAYCRFRYGAIPHDYFIFEFFKKDRSLRNTYLTYYRSEKFIKEIKESLDIQSIGGGKKQFNTIFSKYIKRDWIYVDDVSEEEFCDFLEKHKVVMVKTCFTCSGDNIYKYNYESLEESKKLFIELSGKTILLEEVLVQNKELSKLNSSSVNTIRFATFYANNKVNLIASAIRIGAPGSCVDNLHGIGVAAAVDISTGVIKSDGYDNLCRKHTDFPSSNINLIGFQIPMWDKLLETVKNAAEKAYKDMNIKWVGWDIAILENDVALIEGNPHQSNDLIQLGQEGIYFKLNKLIAK